MQVRSHARFQNFTHYTSNRTFQINIQKQINASKTLIIVNHRRQGVRSYFLYCLLPFIHNLAFREYHLAAQIYTKRLIFFVQIFSKCILSGSIFVEYRKERKRNSKTSGFPRTNIPEFELFVRTGRQQKPHVKTCAWLQSRQLKQALRNMYCVLSTNCTLHSIHSLISVIIQSITWYFKC